MQRFYCMARNIPYEPRLRPQASIPVLVLMAAAVLAILLFMILRSG
jgi:hypothetical protein